MRSVASRENALVKRVRALAHSGRDRRKLGQSVLDGAHLVTAALDAGMPLLDLLVSEHGLARSEHQALLARVGQSCPVVCLPDALFAQIAAVDAPTGLMAVIHTPVVAAPATLTGPALVIDAVQDAGNVGTLLRTAAAAGVGTALLTPGCAQAWSPRVLRAAMGAHFALKVVENADALACLDGFAGEVLVTALADDAVSLFELDLHGQTCWIFGAEGAGVSPALMARATRHVTIPMPGRMESLNVAAAAAVCLFEQVRQRRGA